MNTPPPPEPNTPAAGAQGNPLLRLTGWYGLRLSTRLLLAQALVCVVLLGGLMTLTAWAFKADKSAYVYDVIALRSERLTREILGRVESASLLAKGPLLTRAEAEAFVRDARLPRLPRRGEFFVGGHQTRTGTFVGKPLVLTARDDAWLLFPLPPAILADETTSRAWWTLTDRKLLARSPRLAEERAASLLGREEVKRYLASGLRQGLLTVRREGGEASLSGFEEVPRTNTVLFVETSESEAMAPLVRFIATACLLGSLCILGGLALLRAVFDSLWKPVDRVAAISDAVANGEYAVDVNYPYRDEMAGIFDRLARMARLLSNREAGLRRMARVLEGSLETTRAMTLAPDPFSAVAQVQAQVALRLRFSGPPEGWLALRADDGHVTLLPVSDDERGEAHAQTTWDAYGDTFREELLSRAGRILSDVDVPRGADIHAATDHDVDVALVAFALDKPYLRLAVRRGERMLAHLVGPLMSRQVSSEDLALCRSLCASLRVVLENIDLRSDAAAKARLESELETAEAMQQNMIRVECDDARLDVSARCAPAARVGGDWCGVHEARTQGCVYVFVADVTGHGIDSSLVSAAACGVMNALCSLADSGRAPELAGPPVERLPVMARLLNQSLLRTGRGRYAMTLALACVEPASRRVTWLSCGHTPAWRFGSDAGVASLPARGSLLGLSDDVTFEVKDRIFAEGEALFLYTDGLLENEGPQGERLSPRVLKKLLATLDTGPARATLDAIMAHYARVIGSAVAADDTTCLVLRFRTQAELAADLAAAEAQLRLEAEQTLALDTTDPEDTVGAA